MKTLPLILLAVALSVVGGATAAHLLGPAPETDAELAPMLQRLEQGVAALHDDQQTLRGIVDGLSLQVGTTSDRGDPVSLSQIDAAVERYMSEHGVPVGGGDDAGLATLAPEAGELDAEIDLDAAFARLLEDDIDDSEWQEIFDTVREAGQLDELIALFEHRAKIDPNDPDAHASLGGAYIQKIFEVGSGPAAGVWATKADSSFDAALALDNEHWDARFSKAISLSFWPPIFGKQAEAIGHFETLVEQQESRPPEDRYASTYQLLGNLYMQQGDQAKAKQTFEAGLAIFPGNDDLLATLDTLP